VILAFSLTSCSITQVLDDTYEERFKSKGLNGPKISRIYNQELLMVQTPIVRPVVAVYPTAFTDQTGQRKSNGEFALFSTALTQAPNSLLIKALKNAGNGKFFVVVDRNLDNLTKERQLIRSTRDQLKNEDQESIQLMPLLFAGVLFDGAVISYETNLISGGAGARYLGLGVSTQYRQDTITISLRMTSVNTGEILSEVSATKTVYSYGSSQDVFKFIEASTELVEIEVGNAENESSTVALQMAIEGALLETITLGYERGYWKYE
tara:strand:+ start:2334 stop:3128 length:795 start_codon:yes stop_codon:yes gene_type:complete